MRVIELRPLFADQVQAPLTPRGEAMSEQKSFQAVLDSVPNVVDFLYKNPPKSALNVFTVMMPAEVVRPEFTTWRDEQRSWRETIALHDQSYHMNSLHVRGSEALQLFESLGYQHVQDVRARRSQAVRRVLTGRPRHRRRDPLLPRARALPPRRESCLHRLGPVQLRARRRSMSRRSSTRSGCSTASEGAPSTAIRLRAPSPTSFSKGSTAAPFPRSSSSAPTGSRSAAAACGRCVTAWAAFRVSSCRGRGMTAKQ